MTPHPKEHCEHELEASLHICAKAKNQNSSPCKWKTCSDDTRSSTVPKHQSSKLLKTITDDCQSEIECPLASSAKDLAKRILYYIQCDEQQTQPPMRSNILTVEEIDSILVAMRYGIPSLCTPHIHERTFEKYQRLLKKIESIRDGEQP